MKQLHQNREFWIKEVICSSFNKKITLASKHEGSKASIKLANEENKQSHKEIVSLNHLACNDNGKKCKIRCMEKECKAAKARCILAENTAKAARNTHMKHVSEVSKQDASLREKMN